MIEHLRNLLNHSAWANAVFFHAWGKAGCRDNEELRSRVGHLVGVQEAFLAMLTGDAAQGPPAGPPADFAQLKERAAASHDKLNALLADAGEAQLAATVHIPWFPDPPCVITKAEALVQVAMHSQHHRGQLMTRLRDLGGEPKNVDWIIWLWKGKPDPRW